MDYIKDNPRINSDLDFLLSNDKNFKSFNINKDDILWPAFDGGLEGLVRILHGQQISFKAASTLWRKLKTDLGQVTIETLRTLDAISLKSYGFSKQKQKYLNALIDAVLNKTIVFEKLVALSDEEIILQITNIKGFGLWSAQIYLIFCLKRPNICLQKDLVVDQAVKNLLKLKTKPSLNEVQELSHQWNEKRTAAMLILWHLQIYHFKE